MKSIPTRTIPIRSKATVANTEYWEMASDDQAYVYHWLMTLQSDMMEAVTFDEELRREWFRRRPGLYPRGRRGPNSHASILAGICSQKLRNPSHDLSTPQLDAVEQMFDIIAQYYSDQPDPPRAIRWQRELFARVED